MRRLDPFVFTYDLFTETLLCDPPGVIDQVVYEHTTANNSHIVCSIYMTCGPGGLKGLVAYLYQLDS